MIAAAAVGLSVHTAAARRGFGHAPIAGFAAGLLLVAPVAGGATAFLAFALHRFRAAARQMAATRRAEVDAVEAAELVALGLAGGLSITASHHAALEHASPAVRPSLEELIGQIDRVGGHAALVEDAGAMRASSAVLAGTVASGAPALPALEAHLRAEYHRRHAAEVEAARRLPVRLLVPLTLLVLPGFVLITVGPTIVDSLARLTL
ncbi:MAG: hypothetical protein V3V29_02890 [Acidimicrobiia bacterium]